MHNTLVLIILLVSLNVQYQDQLPVVGSLDRLHLKSSIIKTPDRNAEFKGGQDLMFEFINSNIHYPVDALENGIQGKVVLAFVVNRKGVIENVRVVQGVSITLNGEAKRVIEIMPKWKPGKKAGKRIKTMVRLPIVFTLED